MDLLSNQLRNLNISEDCYRGEDLSDENLFFQNAQTEIKESLSCNVTCGFYCGKRAMAFSMELQVRPIEIVARKLLDVLEGNFAKLKILREIGWCSSYPIDKRYQQGCLIELAWFSILPKP